MKIRQFLFRLKRKNLLPLRKFLNLLVSEMLLEDFLNRMFNRASRINGILQFLIITFVLKYFWKWSKNKNFFYRAKFKKKKKTKNKFYFFHNINRREIELTYRPKWKKGKSQLIEFARKNCSLKWIKVSRL